ncbi:MAG: acetyl-CoA hydrolase/transferase family protein [Chloroflexi bacterium]|uniref:acetyl-CoA hydrolase/transferase family protein n=1 Tax=Candidatus Flexifilum breve TaxID=3140694 RepID=UPI0031348D29|nr:acetyl-CoA hydrolase/transferase family protein [Chloroflexota bacterium]MBK9747990.1 acetyl-CoA hydrolase/transferase family protein [Chloroflexota bacterium]
MQRRVCMITAEEAAAKVKSGQRVFVTGNCSTPIPFLQALVARYEELDNVELVQVLSIGMREYITADIADHIRVNNLFISDHMRKAVNSGTSDFTPIFLSEIPSLFRDGLLPIDIAVIHVSPPDEHGYCSYGVEVGVTKSAAESAQMVIALINPHMPRTLGDSFIHVNQIDYCIHVDYELPQVNPHPASEIQDRIAEHIAALIPDGATLQTGIGGIPDAVLSRLTNHKNLGIHTELFSDGVMHMVEAGVVTCRAKSIHTGKVVAGFVIGTKALFDYVNDNPIIELHPTEYVNDPFIIAQNDKMVSINSALEVDLTGQVCADSIGTKFYSGVGGQVDFVRGACRSKGGMSIIALPSTAKDDTLSRIVPMLKPGAGVTTTRNDVRYIATEYGIATLFGKTIAQRVQELINVAHPKFREELAAAAREQFAVGRVYSLA